MTIRSLTDDDIEFARKNLDKLGEHERKEFLQLLENRDQAERIQRAHREFIYYVECVWPQFIAGAHHRIMAEAFERVARGQLKRLIINMAPRHTKSEFASWLLPSWFLGKFPRKKIIQASNTEHLAGGFGRRVRNLIDNEGAKDILAHGGLPYTTIFPHMALAKDSQSATGWHTSQGGEYFAVGVNGRVTGIGGDIVIIDDPHSEQEARQAETDPTIFDGVYEWYTSGPRQRLQPGGAIIIVMTRWSKRDLTGQIIRKMQENTDDAGNVSGDKWEVIELPALLDEGTATERPMWPGFWKLEELKATRAELPVPKWKAQYQQQPTSNEGAILKADYWRRWGAENEKCPGQHLRKAWDKKDPPPCDYIISSWDTAHKKESRNDFSANTVWGVFQAEEASTGKLINNVILLSAWKDRLDFPELKRRVKRFYDEDNPDTLLIEDKGSGISLIQELRAMGMPVANFSYGRGTKALPNDKTARANLVADIFASGYVWAPERRFADEVITECNDFPGGDFDDYVDTTVQAMLRFRSGKMISTANDDSDELDDLVASRVSKRRYY